MRARRTTRAGNSSLTTYLFSIFTALLFLLANAPASQAFPNGFYTRSLPPNAPALSLPDNELVWADNEKMKQLLDTVSKKADHLLKMDNIDHIDIGIGETKNDTYSPIYFRRDELELFLAKEHHRNLLVVCFQGGMQSDGYYRQHLEDLKPFLAEIDFRRVLVVGAAAGGYHVYMDKEYEPTASKGGSVLEGGDCARYISLYGGSKPIDIGIGRKEVGPSPTGETAKGRWLMTFRVEDVELFLKSDHCKTCLVVTVVKGKKEDVSEKMDHFFHSLGYEHINVQDGLNFFQVEPTVVTPDGSSPSAKVDARYTSEWIGVLEYEGLQSTERITLENPPVANYHFLYGLMGPPYGRGSFPLAYEFAKSKLASKEWQFEESMLPAKGSKWIVFIRYFLPNKRRAFETFDGAHGRIECTNENLENVMDGIESTHPLRFEEFDRKRIHEICN